MLTEVARTVLEKRYLMKDESGKVTETPEDMFERVARTIAGAEIIFGKEDEKVWKERFYNLMISGTFLPNSPTLANAGRQLGQLSACFVIPVPDSMEGIFGALYDQVMVHRTGGGCVKQGTLVVTKKGIKRIEQVEKGDEVISLDENTGKSIWSKVIATHMYDIQDAFEITLIGGQQATTSSWHPFMMFDGERIIEKRADQIQVGDFVITPSINPVESNDYDWLVGFFVGDGNFAQENIQLCVSEGQEFIVDEVARLTGFRYSIQTKGTVPYIRIQGGYIKEMLHDLFPMGKKSTTSLLPKDTPAAIAGLFDADGWFDNRGVFLELANSELIEQVATLLTVWGIHTVVGKNHTSGKNSQFGSTRTTRLQITSKLGLERFSEIVGPFLKRTYVTRKAFGKTRCNVSPKVPHKHDGRTTTYNWEKGLCEISAESALKLIENSLVRQCIKNSIPVKSIAQVSGGKFFDLTVEGVATYAAGRNGLMFIHNTGFSFSRLRPEGDVVHSSGGKSSGPVSFMKVFDAATEQVKQGGFRRGANMAILRVDHPDIEKFVTLKDPQNTVLRNFNISVAATDEFMTMVKNGKDLVPLVNPRDGKMVGAVHAKELFDKIAYQAWLTGDPGLWFIDRTNEASPCLNEKMEATNPCGEQPLLPYESCNLGSINVSAFADVEKAIKWDDLKQTVHWCVRFLDDVIEVNKYPVPEIEQVTMKWRKIGLGIMGWADLLSKLKIPYDSEQALELAEMMMDVINDEAIKASVQLAKERGPFPGWKETKYKDMEEPPRNVTRTTIAPTGTIALIAGCSSGIEPHYALVYVRKMAEGNELYMINEDLKKQLAEIDTEIMPGTKISMQIVPETLMKDFNGSLQQFPGIPQNIKDAFKTAHDIGWEWHVKIQAAFQKFTDNAVSKTINMPHDATVQDVANAYMLAYELGCKGITVYRDGSKSVQVLSTKASVETPQESHVKVVPVERPEAYDGRTFKIKTGHGSAYVTINADENGQPAEVFARIGKAGGCGHASMEAICRLLSVSLRSGVDPEVLIDQLRGIRCAHTAIDKEPILSEADAIGAALQRYFEKKNGKKVNGAVEIHGNCPICETGTLIFQEGCEKCTNCDYNKCG